MIDLKEATDSGFVIFCPECSRKYNINIEHRHKNGEKDGDLMLRFIELHEKHGESQTLNEIDKRINEIDDGWATQLIMENPKMTFKQIRALYNQTAPTPVMGLPKISKRHPLIEEALKLFPGSRVVSEN